MDESHEIDSNPGNSTFLGNELPESLLQVLDERGQTLDCDYLTVEESFRLLRAKSK